VAEGADEGQTTGAQSVTPDVFISYASQDSAVANAIIELLEGNGLRCWIAPRDVTPGSHYADGIMFAIGGAKALVLVLSGSALTSKHVGKEVERASSKGRPIIALHIDAAPLTPAFEYFLSESQWIDVGAGGLAAVAAKLVEAVRLHLDTTVANEPRPPLGTSVAPRAATLPGWRWAIAGGIILSLAFAYFFVDRLWLSKRAAVEKPVVAIAPAGIPAAPMIPEKSVAVLPFVDMSEKKDQEYFSDGLSEELIDMLSKVPELRVPARTSSFYFKGKQATIAEISRALSVSHVLEGSVRKSGNKLRVTAQLIRVDNGYHVWSETYDRKLDDIFKIQDDIAYSVVKALKVSLLATQAPRATGTKTVDAYTLLLQGQFFLLQGGTKEDTERAIDCYEQVLRLEPTSAPAWAGLSRGLVSLATYTPSRRVPLGTRALDAANRALSLNPRLAEAHIALGKIHLILDWDWPSAQAAFREARELDPANSYPFFWTAEVARVLGHNDEALQYYREAITRDPLNTGAYSSMATVYYALGRFQEAEVAIRKVSELTKNQSGLHGEIGILQLYAGGDPAAALAEINRETDDEFREYALAFSYAFLGRKADADPAFARYQKTYAVDHPYTMAILHAIRGEPDQAFEWIDRAYQQHDDDLENIKASRSLEHLRFDPRYKEILRKMKLPE
jgi:TolB-like protein/tetratricopeptide (TPR) repeat protein